MLLEYEKSQKRLEEPKNSYIFIFAAIRLISSAFKSISISVYYLLSIIYIIYNIIIYTY
jgi:hypothetical protein